MRPTSHARRCRACCRAPQRDFRSQNERGSGFCRQCARPATAPIRSHEDSGGRRPCFRLIVRDIIDPRRCGRDQSCVDRGQPTWLQHRAGTCAGDRRGRDAAIAYPGSSHLRRDHPPRGARAPDGALRGSADARTPPVAAVWQVLPGPGLPNSQRRQSRRNRLGAPPPHGPQPRAHRLRG